MPSNIKSSVLGRFHATLRSTLLSIGFCLVPLSRTRPVRCLRELQCHPSSNNNDSNSSWYYGPGVGAYYDFLHAGPIAAGFDLRGNFLFGDKQKYRSALFGVRVAAKPPLLPIKPYAQFSVGAGGAKYTGPSNLATRYSTKFQYQVLGGIDVTVLPHIDLRLAEVGYGRMSGVGGGTNTPADSLVSVGSGVVFRFF